MRDGLASDGILLVQGEDNLCGMLNVLDQGVGGDEVVPDEEHKFQEGPELDCPEVACALGISAGPEAEVEGQLYQVGYLPGLLVEGGGSRSHNELDDAQGGWIFTLGWGIFYPISF